MSFCFLADAIRREDATRWSSIGWSESTLDHLWDRLRKWDILLLENSRNRRFLVTFYGATILIFYVGVADSMHVECFVHAHVIKESCDKTGKMPSLRCDTWSFCLILIQKRLHLIFVPCAHREYCNIAALHLFLFALSGYKLTFTVL